MLYRCCLVSNQFKEASHTEHKYITIREFYIAVIKKDLSNTHLTESQKKFFFSVIVCFVCLF